MGHPIVICCDGTKNTFGRPDTNVRRVFDALNDTPCHRYYDPGLGTDSKERWLDRISKPLSNIGASALALGQTRKVFEAYSFLSRHYVRGTKVYLFGFSRGAWCVRRLAKMVAVVGLPPPGCEHLIPQAYDAYERFKNNESKDGSVDEFCESFQALGHQRMVESIFIGVWDTVRSAGLKLKSKDCELFENGKTAIVGRHALALDEKRRAFEPELWDDDPRVKQMWFPGDHSDVGGGHDVRSDRDLSYLSLAWICDEANQSGLKFDIEPILEKALNVRSRLSLDGETVNDKSNLIPFSINRRPIMSGNSKRRISDEREIEIDPAVRSRVEKLRSKKEAKR